MGSENERLRICKVLDIMGPVGRSQCHEWDPALLSTMALTVMCPLESFIISLSLQFFFYKMDCSYLF